jgi:xanthine/CO dehydrogenase XdhC/CoxF family maturation factor
MAENFRIHRPTKLSVIWQAGLSSLLGTHLRDELATIPPHAEVFSDDVQPPPHILVLGAGDDAKPVVRLAKELGWHVTVGDSRGEFATKSRFPGADAVVVCPTSELIGAIAPPPDALAVVMTHHYVHDVPLLRDLLPRSLPYVGLLGPKKRAGKILKDLQSQGHIITPAQLERLHAPVGLDLGAETPEEVALSIISEMRATLAQRDGRPLRDRDRAIHEDIAPHNLRP